nr:hypothetical protein RVX_3242 [Nitratidesulfovibrio sp. HK-II]
MRHGGNDGVKRRCRSGHVPKSTLPSRTPPFSLSLPPLTQNYRDTAGPYAPLQACALREEVSEALATPAAKLRWVVRGGLKRE